MYLREKMGDENLRDEMERLERNGDEGEYPDEDTATLDMIAFIISRVRLEEREVRYSGNTRGHDNAEVDPVTTGRQPRQKRRQKKIEPGKKDKNQGDLEAGICKKLCKTEKTRRIKETRKGKTEGAGRQKSHM